MANQRDQRYLVTARKYRPKQFSELVAQEHVTDTLKNAIRLDRLAHAYLFSGPRGVGKTTAARVLAKAINCTTPLDEREDEAEPCRSCDSCQAFEAGRSLNIFEIDAASNNKVDDIRELRETVRIPPQGSKKKVYIIDEVHMLSKQAFNALLKTLEEPPPHALFIFATTEPHKVLPTILSRCQRFDFRRIPAPEVVERLREICTAEDITADEESLMLLARKGDGALRDALSAFDQAVSLCGTDIEYGELAQALGVVDLDLFFTLTDHVVEQNSAGVLRLVDDVVHTGYDLQEFVTGLAEHLRNLLVAHTLEDNELIEVAEATRERYAAASQDFSEADLLRLLMIAGDAEEKLKNSTQPRLKLEMALLKMATLTRSADLREALQKIDRLETMAKEGELPAAMPSPSDGHSTAPEQGKPDPVPSPSPEPVTSEPAASYEPSVAQKSNAPAPSEPPAGEDEPPDEPPDEAEDDPDPEPADSVDDEPEEPITPQPTAPPSPSGEPADEEPADQPEPASGYRDLFGTPALKQTSDPSSDAPQNEISEGDSPSSPSAALSDHGGGVATATAPEVATASPNPEVLASAWSSFVQSVKQKPILFSHLCNTEPMGLQDGTVQIAVPDAHHRRQLTDHHSFLRKQLEDALNRPVERISFVVHDASEGTSNGETPDENDPYERMRQLRHKYPVIETLFDEFGGELVW